MIQTTFSFPGDFSCLRSLSDLTEVYPYRPYDSSILSLVSSHLEGNHSVKRRHIEKLIKSQSFFSFITKERLFKYKGIFIDDALPNLLSDFLLANSKDFPEMAVMIKSGLYPFVHRDIFISLLNHKPIKDRFVRFGLFSNDFEKVANFNQSESTFFVQYIKSLKENFYKDIERFDYPKENTTTLWKYYLLRELFLDQKLASDVRETISLTKFYDDSQKNIERKIKDTIERRIKSTALDNYNKEKEEINEHNFNSMLYNHLLFTGQITLEDITQMTISIINISEFSYEVSKLDYLVDVQNRKDTADISNETFSFTKFKTNEKTPLNGFVISKFGQLKKLIGSENYIAHLNILSKKALKGKDISKRAKFFSITSFISLLSIPAIISYSGASNFSPDFIFATVLSNALFCLVSFGFWIFTGNISSSKLLTKNIFLEEELIKSMDQNELRELYQQIIKVEAFNFILDMFKEPDRKIQYYYAPRRKIYSKNMLNIDKEPNKFILTSDYLLELLEKKEGAEGVLNLKEIETNLDLLFPSKNLIEKNR